MTVVMERLEQQAADAEQRAARLRRMVELAQELGADGLAEFIDLLGSDKPGMNGNHDGKANGHEAVAERVPRGREAVRQVVAERPGLWTLSQIVEEMTLRGWFTSRKGAEVAVSRMLADGEGRRERKGVYEFPAPPREVVMLP